jgi:Skp family chaperone for outer membrane proteins
LRWACANKNDISTVIYQWTAGKAEEARAAEKLSPDMKTKVAAYETLANQWNQMRMSHPALMMVRPMRPGQQAPEEPTAEQKEYNDLAKKVAEAKQPVADIIDRRNRESTELNQKYSVENIVAEYAKGKYDVVADSGFGGHGVLYSSSGDVMDITQSVINYFKDKQK